jgi:hypothetical protein
MKEFLTFEEAREFTRKLKLKNKEEWYKYKKNELDDYPPKPSYIPSQPEQVYHRQGWIDYKDWLGTESEYLPFEEAREFVRKLNLKTTVEWKKYRKGELDNYPPKPSYIPSQPEQVYHRQGWINYKNWLKNPPLTYEEAQAFVIKLNLSSYEEWNSYCKGEIQSLGKKPDYIPRSPDCKFQNKGWVNWEHWLTGYTERKMGEWLSYEEAKDFVHSLKLKSYSDWKKYSKGMLPGYKKRPINIPSGPDYVYKGKGWVSYSEWLGI